MHMWSRAQLFLLIHFIYQYNTGQHVAFTEFYIHQFVEFVKFVV